MIKNKLSEGDVVLLLLYANDCSPIRGRTRFQKTLFVFEEEIYKQYGFDREITGQQLFNFAPDNYGPFSVKAYKLLEFFINIGMVGKAESNIDGTNDYEIINSDLEKLDDLEDVTLPSMYKDENYFLSAKGREFVEKKLLSFYKDEKKEILDNFKKKFVDNPLNDILKYVYTKYPEMTTKSKIKDKVLNSNENF